MTIQIPHVREQLQRTIYDFLSPFLSTGNVIEFSSGEVTPYNCDIKFDIQELSANADNPGVAKPLIVVAGSRRMSTAIRRKCIDPRNPKNVGAETLHRISRSVYVAVCEASTYKSPEGDVTQAGDLRVCTRVWDVMYACFLEKRQRLQELGMINADLDADPVAGRNEAGRMLFLWGSLEFDCFVQSAAS